MVEASHPQMKAIVCDGNGGSDVLKVGDRPLPELPEGDTHFLIKIEYTALNRADIMQRKGSYPPPPGTTDVLGLECLGNIVLEKGVGEDDDKLGDRVIALLPGGGYAQYCKVNKEHVIRVPEGYDSEKAACFMEVWATAY